jgi:serine/threonine protein kinase
MVARFLVEARPVNQIRHKNIVDIFSFGSLDDGRQHCIMELLEGVTLEEHLDQSGKLEPKEALPILRRVARALDAAHAAGIAHRDLEPDDVFLVTDEDGVAPKLLEGPRRRRGGAVRIERFEYPLAHACQGIPAAAAAAEGAAGIIPPHPSSRSTRQGT